MIDFSAYILSEWSWVVLFVIAIFVGMSKNGQSGIDHSHCSHARHGIRSKTLNRLDAAIEDFS